MQYALRESFFSLNRSFSLRSTRKEGRHWHHYMLKSVWWLWLKTNNGMERRDRSSKQTSGEIICMRRKLLVVSQYITSTVPSNTTCVCRNTETQDESKNTRREHDINGKYWLCTMCVERKGMRRKELMKEISFLCPSCDRLVLSLRNEKRFPLEQIAKNCLSKQKVVKRF